jgi:hypothetical protein
MKNKYAPMNYHLFLYIFLFLIISCSEQNNNVLPNPVVTREVDTVHIFDILAMPEASSGIYDPIQWAIRPHFYELRKNGSSIIDSSDIINYSFNINYYLVRVSMYGYFLTYIPLKRYIDSLDISLYSPENDTAFYKTQMEIPPSDLGLQIDTIALLNFKNGRSESFTLNCNNRATHFGVQFSEEDTNGNNFKYHTFSIINTPRFEMSSKMLDRIGDSSSKFSISIFPINAKMLRISNRDSINFYISSHQKTFIRVKYSGYSVTVWPE